MKKVNYTLVGIFVLVAIGILIFSVIAFSSLSFNKKTQPFILYFSDSVSGLAINSAVKYKGVKIGYVREIPLRHGNEDVPVIVEIDSVFADDYSVASLSSRDEKTIQLVEESGYRAMLKPENLLTGMLYIDLNIFPGTPVKWHEPGKYPEIPTVNSSIAEITASASKIFSNLAKVDFAGIANQSIEISKRLNRALDQFDFEGINKNLVGASASARAILEAPETRELVKNLNAFSKNLNGISKSLENNLDSTLIELRKTIISVNSLTTQMGKTMAEFNGAVGNREGGIGGELYETLEQINDAMRAIRNLADHLNNNPDKIIWGNPNE